jgi:hypothetical protein
MCVAAAALIVVAGTFAFLKNIDSASSVAGLDKLEKQAKREVVAVSSQKQSKAASPTPTQEEQSAVAPGSPAQKLTREGLVAERWSFSKPETAWSAEPWSLSVEPQTVSRSPVQRLSREDAELMKPGQELTRGGKLTVTDTVAHTAKRAHDRQIIGDLVKRGRELMSAGKVGDARVLLSLAAEANDSTAAFMLATTYDPIVLQKLKNADSCPDIKIASAWYQKAADLGSTEASNWLKAAGSNRD